MLRRHVFYGAEWGKIIENGLSLKMVTSSPLSTIIHDFPLIQMRIDFKELNYRLFTFKKKVFYVFTQIMFFALEIKKVLLHN